MGGGQGKSASTNSENKEPNNPETKAEVKTPPHNYLAIVKGDKELETTPIENHFDKLYTGVFLNNNKMKYWIKKGSHNNAFLFFARNLWITWGETTRYWRWNKLEEISGVSVEIAELLDVCWLEITGKFEMENFTPKVVYEVLFRVMVKKDSYGWEVPVNLKLTVPNENQPQSRDENLNEKSKDKWHDIKVGEFTATGEEGHVEVSLCQYKDGRWKKGLVIKGVVIQPLK